MKKDIIPDKFLGSNLKKRELFVYDFKMTQDVVKSKVDLGMHMFSFLQVGKKQVHFADTSVAVNPEQSLILKKGNWLWTELLDHENNYYCKLLFFSDHQVEKFIKKHLSKKETQSVESISYFTIENDSYIESYLNSLAMLIEQGVSEELLAVKFEEIMLYLLHKYQDRFELFLRSLISSKKTSFNLVVEQNTYSNLSIEEIAFLCHMSISTFKRHFGTVYGATPGKWFQDKRLHRAKQVLEEGSLKASDIYSKYGYNNLSNFCIAFKKKFGVNPGKTSQNY